MYGLDFDKGGKGENHKKAADKVYESGRLEVFGAGHISHSIYRSLRPSEPSPSRSFSVSSETSFTTTASSSSSCISSKSSSLSNRSREVMESRHETPPPRLIFCDDRLILTPMSACVIQQTPSTGGWEEVPDTMTQIPEVAPLIPHREYLPPPSVPSKPLSASKLCHAPIHNISTPSIHQYSLHINNSESEGKDAAWLKERKKDWRMKRCFKSRLDTVEELKRIPQVEGRRKREKTGLPRQKLTDLVETEYRDVGPNSDWMESIELRPITAAADDDEDESRKDNKKRHLDFSEPPPANNICLIPHSRSASQSNYERPRKRTKIGETVFPSSINLLRQIPREQVSFQPTPLPLPILNHDGPSKLLVQIPHRSPEHYESTRPVAEYDLMILVSNLFKKYSDETAEAASKLANGYPVGSFFFKPPKGIGNKEEQKARAKKIAKEFCRVASQSTKKMASLRMSITGFLSFRQRGRLIYLGAISGTEVPLEVVSSRMSMHSSCSELGSHALSNAASCFENYPRLLDDEEEEGLAHGPEVYTNISTSRKYGNKYGKLMKGGTKEALKKVAGGKAILNETLAWLREKKLAKKEKKKRRSESKKRAQELLAVVKQTKEKLMASKSYSNDDEEDTADEQDEEEGSKEVEEEAQVQKRYDDGDGGRRSATTTSVTSASTATSAISVIPATRAIPATQVTRASPATPATPATPALSVQFPLLTQPLHGLCSTVFAANNQTLIEDLSAAGIVLHSHPAIDLVSCEMGPASALILQRAEEDTKLLIKDISTLRTLSRYKHIFIILLVRAGLGPTGNRNPIPRSQGALTDLHNCAGDDSNGDMLNIIHTNADSVCSTIKELFELSRGEGERDWLKDFVGGRHTVQERIEEVIQERTHWSVFQAELEFGEQG